MLCLKTLELRKLEFVYLKVAHHELTHFRKKLKTWKIEHILWCKYFRLFKKAIIQLYNYWEFRCTKITILVYRHRLISHVHISVGKKRKLVACIKDESTDSRSPNEEVILEWRALFTSLQCLPEKAYAHLHSSYFLELLECCFCFFPWVSVQNTIIRGLHDE